MTATVEALVEAVTSRYDLVARYYRLKAKLLGVEELYEYDRYAPLPAADHFYTWDEARELVLSSYGRFHPRHGGDRRLVLRARLDRCAAAAGQDGRCVQQLAPCHRFTPTSC